MNRLESKLHNAGERLVPYISHNDAELIRHRSSYVFFYNVINSDQNETKPEETTIVDLGFGSGWGSSMLSGIEKSKIVGVDNGLECETYAKQNFSRSNVSYVIEDARIFVSKMKESDYVVSRGVLEHIPNGIDLIKEFKFKKRIIIDVPYDEDAGNCHHLEVKITEKDFKDFKNCEIFYEDINGAIYKDHCPKNANMIMAVISDPSLKKVGDMFEFPILPIRNQEIEIASERNKISRITWLERNELFPEVMKKIQPVLIGFDIGSGIVPHDYLEAMIYVCCEPYDEYTNVLVENISEVSDRSYVVQNKDWFTSISNLKDNSIDSIYLIDVIEHLPKEEGIKLLAMTERVVRKQIVIFTPLGFVEQEIADGGKDGWGLDGADFQEHKSGWMPDDFDKTWDIYACRNFHILNNLGKKVKKPFGAFWAIKNMQKNFQDTHIDFNTIPSGIKKELFESLPSKYFDTVRKYNVERNNLQGLQAAHQDLMAAHQDLAAAHQDLAVAHQRLLSSRTVTYANRVKKNLKKIGMRR